MNNKNKIIRTAKNLESLIWDSVIKKFSEAKSAQEIDHLFNSLMTVQEKESVARRLAVVSLIHKGLSYKEIGERLWVSPVTISTIKKSITSKSGYRSYHEIKRGVSGVGNAVSPSASEKESAFSEWLDHVAFVIENGPQISGPRWRFLNYNRTLPKKYRYRK